MSNTAIALDRKAISQTLALIQEALFQGATGYDMEALERAHDALLHIYTGDASQSIKHWRATNETHRTRTSAPRRLAK